MNITITKKRARAHYYFILEKKALVFLHVDSRETIVTLSCFIVCHVAFTPGAFSEVR